MVGLSAEELQADRARWVGRWSKRVAVLAPVAAFVVLVIAGVWLMQQSLRPTSKTGGFGLLGTCLFIGAVLPAVAAVLLTRLQRGVEPKQRAGIALAWTSAALTTLLLAPTFITSAVPAEIRWRQALQQPLTAAEQQSPSAVQDGLREVYRNVANRPRGAAAEWTGWVSKPCSLSNEGNGTYWWDIANYDYLGKGSGAALDTVVAAAEAHHYSWNRATDVDSIEKVTVTTKWGKVSATGLPDGVSFYAETACVR